MLTKHVASLTATLAFAATLNAQGTRLLRHPAVSKDLVAFEYAGDLWVVGRNGGAARRPTATAGAEGGTLFSPAGGLVASTWHVGRPPQPQAGPPARGGRPQGPLRPSA